jgi:hypothetical protein
MGIMFRRTAVSLIVLCLGSSVALNSTPVSGAQVPTLPVPPVPGTGPVAVRVAFDSAHDSLPAAYYGYHGFTVFGADNNPLYGLYSKFTAVVAGVNGPKTIEGYLDYYGRGIFGYYGERAGVDELTVTVGTAAGTAARTYGANPGSLPQPNTSAPARVTFDSPTQSLPAPWYGYHGFSVTDTQGRPVYGQYSSFTAVVAGTNGPITINGQLDYYGRGTIGYYAGKAGADTITLSVGAATGEAARTYGASAQPPPNPIPPLPPVPNAPQGPVAARVTFDEATRSDPAPWYGYHGFTVYDAQGSALTGQYPKFTATVQGVNGPKTFEGYLDYYGRGVFSYHADKAGVDSLTVVVGPASGEATRTYGVSNPSLPQVNDRPPARVAFDNATQTLPSPWYGYHGFTVLDAQGSPVYGRYLQFTAVVAGPNGPLTINGQLDYYGRGTIGYWADKPGVDSITVNAATANGTAARTYAPNVQPPPTGVPPLPPVQSPNVPAVAARVAFDQAAQSLPAPSYGYHYFTVFGADNKPLYGQYSKFTAVVSGTNGPKTIEGNVDYWGRGVFGYNASAPGADTLTVSVGAATGEAARTYGAPNQNLPNPNAAAPAKITFDAPVQTLPAPWYGYHGFLVTDASNNPVYGQYSAFTAVVAGSSGPKTVTGFLDYYGRGSIGYYADKAGADVITVNVGAATGGAQRTYTGSATVPPNPIPPLPPLGAPPVNDNPAVRVSFDDAAAALPSPSYGCHSFTAYDAMGKPVSAVSTAWTIALTGANGAGSYSGYLDYWGRGTFCYWAATPGTDTITASVGKAAGTAVRAYAPSNPIPPLPGAPAPPDVNGDRAAFVRFDDDTRSLPSPWFGYHGFTVLDAQGTPLYGTYRAWTAVVSGPNGPVTLGGQLDYYGRGTVGYYAGRPGVDLVKVTVGKAVGAAARTYSPDVSPPPLAIPSLPAPSPEGGGSTPVPSEEFDWEAHGEVVIADSEPLPGGGPPPAVVERTADQYQLLRADAPAFITTPACDTAPSEPRILAIVVTPQDISSDPADVATARSTISELAKSMNVGTGPYRDQDIRWARNNAGEVIVCTALVTAIGDDNGDGSRAGPGDRISVGQIVKSLADQKIVNVHSEKRKYAIWVRTGISDLFCGGRAVAGCADFYKEDRPGQANLNNQGGSVAVTDVQYSNDAAAQELFHSLGAVQSTAPHSCASLSFRCGAHTGQWHDFMNRGYRKSATLNDCDDDPSTTGTLDCGHDDYYSTLCALNVQKCPGAEGESGPTAWLATHWNLAESKWLSSIRQTNGSKTCNGLTTTGPDSQGDEHSEKIDAGAAGDVISALDGYDTVLGNEGSDSICGGDGKDTLRGGIGNDVVRGTYGNDRVFGGESDDTVYGNTENDELFGGDGNDILYDGPGHDTVDGGPGLDTWRRCPGGQESSSNVELVFESQEYCS